MPENKPALEDVKQLRGQIERITYSDAESGYSVLRLRVSGAPELVTVVGTFISPAVGEMLELTGTWQQHPKFGVQFKADTSRSSVPSSLSGMEKYLGSGLVRGIGPSLAARIMERFGAEAFEVLDSHPERLMELSGVGEKKATAIAASWSEQREMRDVMPFLQGYGIGTGYAVRVYRQYGANTIQVLQENPYRLAIDIFGIGFVTADKIARSMGFAPDSPLRVRAGVLHVMNELVGEGNVYAPIMELAAKSAEILGVSQDQAERGIEEARLAEEIVCEWYKDGSGQDDCAVYLPAFQYAEVHSAMNLLALLSAPFNGQYVDPEAAIPWVQQELGVELAERQKDALRLAIRSQVMVITGGPGTGKTTLIRAVLKIREARGYKVMLAAPTGRAAKRMTEATGHEAKTIHRMLEYVGRGTTNGDFMRNENNPLECDLLIVDEASMIDQILFHYLLKAIPKGASLILVGDVDQLPSVGSGNVLRDIIDSHVCPVVTLNEIFRQAQESRIIVNAHKVNAGQMPELYPEQGGPLKDFYFIQTEDPLAALETVKTLVTDRIPKRFGFDPIADIQVLTPMHNGTVGTKRLNAELQAVLNKSGGAKVQRLGRVLQEGDKVMQIKNNYEKDVYNGDIGTIYKISGEDNTITVKMDSGLVSYDFTELDELVHAYAISIHKSQGSEYPAVVIPILTQHYVMLQRNLLYTAITRGKKLVIIVGTKRALQIAVKNDKTKKRWTRLAERLSWQKKKEETGACPVL